MLQILKAEAKGSCKTERDARISVGFRWTSASLVLRTKRLKAWKVKGPGPDKILGQMSPKTALSSTLKLEWLGLRLLSDFPQPLPPPQRMYWTLSPSRRNLETYENLAHDFHRWLLPILLNYVILLPQAVVCSQKKEVVFPSPTCPKLCQVPVPYVK